jgi:hypothetical protein
MDSENSNDTDYEKKKLNNRFNNRKAYLKHKLGLDISNMTKDEILNYEIKQGRTKKYQTDEERKAYIQSMKSEYNKTI